MRLYCGIDLHSNNSVVVILDETDKVIYQKKKSKTNGIIATKAVANKLARACYHILTDQVAFDVDKAFA